MKEKAKTRRIPMDEGFMNFTVEDILYGMISLNATYNPNRDIQYISYDNLLKVKQEYKYAMCVRSRQTVDNRFKKLVKGGYIIEEIENDKTIYILTQYSDIWEIIDYEMLRYLVATRNTNTIKIYCYLLNKYKWKRKTNEYYSFTDRELCLALGYSKSSASAGTITSIISMIIESLDREGIIKVANYFDGKSPRMRLLKVVEKKTDLQKTE